LAKSRKQSDHGVDTAADRSFKLLSRRPSPAGHTDIAARAYDLYLLRRCEHGLDVADWLQAEHELLGAGRRRR
jgi:hypothetical protein